MKTLKENKNIKVMLSILFIALIGILLVDLLINNVVNGGEVTCIHCGSTNTEEKPYSNNKHEFFCKDCLSYTYTDHFGGNHTNNGVCELCSTQYQNHSADGTTVAGGIDIGGAHQVLYACMVEGCTSTFEGGYESHKNYTHANGGKCTVCNAQVENHSADGTTVAGGIDIGGAHQVLYACMVEGCTSTFEGGYESHRYTYVDNEDGTCTGTCQVCSYIAVPASHNYENGACINCGLTQPTGGGTGNNGGTTECTHDYQRESDENNHWEQCSKCNAVKNGSKEPHTEVIDAAVEATCKTEGKTEGKHCSVCNEVIVAQATVAKLPHTEVIDAAVEATCKAEGKTEGKHCSVCNEIILAQNIIEKKAHSYKDGVCENCGARETEECEHIDSEMKNNATQHWEECKECGEKISGTLENHKYETYTSNDDGTHSSTCTVCNYNLKEEHAYVDGECEDCGAEEPEEETCEHDYNLEKNTTHHWEECTKCNEKKTQEEHKYGEYKDNNNGTHTVACSVCGYELTEEHETDGICPDCDNIEPTPGDDEDKENDNDEDKNQVGNNNVTDNTVVDKDIPHTGAGNIALITIFVIGIAGAISAVKMRNYKGI